MGRWGWCCALPVVVTVATAFGCLASTSTPSDAADRLSHQLLPLQVGVAGRTGCGKSTLMMTLYRLGGCCTVVLQRCSTAFDARGHECVYPLLFSS